MRSKFLLDFLLAQFLLWKWCDACEEGPRAHNRCQRVRSSDWLCHFEPFIFFLQVKARVRSINRFADIIECVQAEVVSKFLFIFCIIFLHFTFVLFWFSIIHMISLFFFWYTSKHICSIHVLTWRNQISLFLTSESLSFSSSNATHLSAALCLLPQMTHSCRLLFGLSCVLQICFLLQRFVVHAPKTLSPVALTKGVALLGPAVHAGTMWI